MSGYCQFSGGEDIRIDSQQSILIVQGEIKGDDDGGVSPIYDGTSLQSVSIEAKKGEYDHEKLKYQHYAGFGYAVCKPIAPVQGIRHRELWDMV